MNLLRFTEIYLFATNFGDEIIKNLNFQKMVPNVVPVTPSQWEFLLGDPVPKSEKQL